MVTPRDAAALACLWEEWAAGQTVTPGSMYPAFRMPSGELFNIHVAEDDIRRAEKLLSSVRLSPKGN